MTQATNTTNNLAAYITMPICCIKSSNGSPLFTGGTGSGESEIRRYILEADLLEAIVALPTDMFDELRPLEEIDEEIKEVIQAMLCQLNAVLNS